MKSTQHVWHGMRSIVALGIWLAVEAAIGPVCWAQVPHVIRYQGQSVDNLGAPLEGPYTLTFRLYNAATGGTKIWEETQTNVPLTKGHFSVLLGQVTPLTCGWTAPLWLSVQINAGAEMSPRQQMTSVPLAMRSEVAEQLDGPLSTSTGDVLVAAGSRVGIGTTTLRAPFHLNGGATNGYDMIADNNGDRGGALGFYKNGAQYGGIGLSGKFEGNTGTDIEVASNVDGGNVVFFTGGTSIKAIITAAGNVGIGTMNPGNILAVKQNSATDPIADSWTVYPCDRQHKQILQTVTPRGYLDRIKTVKLYEWKRKPSVTDEEALHSLAADEPNAAPDQPRRRYSPQTVQAKKQQLLAAKTQLPKFATKRVGVAIDDADVPPEILVQDAQGNKTGLDLLAYVGYLHTALQEAAVKIDALESRVAALERRR